MTAGHTLLSGSEKLRLREVFTSAWDSESLPGYIRTYVFVRFSSPHGHREMYPPEPNSVRMSLQWVRIEESAGSGTLTLEPNLM